MAASMPLPDGVSEGGYIGEITGEVLDVIKRDINALYVPANSKIVFEGSLSTTETALEGPFGEIHACVFPGDSHPQPVCNVDRTTHRTNAMLPVSNSGCITDETHTMIGTLAAAEICQVRQQHGLPINEAMTQIENQVTWVPIQTNTLELWEMKLKPEQLRQQIGDLIF